MLTKIKYLLIIFFVFTLNENYAQRAWSCGTQITGMDFLDSIEVFEYDLIPDSRTFRVYIHIIHRDLGGGVSVNEIDVAMTKLADGFRPLNIQFYVEPLYDNIYNSLWCDYPDSYIPEIFSYNRHNDGIDIYILPYDVIFGGIAENIPATALIVDGYLAQTLGIAHEMGHCFGLYHTHSGSYHPSYCPNCGCDDNANCWENPDGSNSTTCGDRVSDTPADPCLSGRVFNDCTLYSIPTGYAPDPNLIMSYSGPDCWEYFTPGQSARMNTFFANYEPLRNCLIETRLFTVDQRLSNNQSFGQVGRWEINDFIYYNMPKYDFGFIIDDDECLQGEQSLHSIQKFHRWNDLLNDITNHHVFPISQSSPSNFISWFQPVHQGITIKNSLEGTTLNGGQIRIKDPWLIDYPDPDYANTLRNRGMDIEGPDKLEFRNQSSPFTPDLTSSYNGYVYKGIFLNQSGPGSNWQGSFYAVGSFLEQTISVNNQNRKFYPFKWGGTGVTLQDSNDPETGIVFNNSTAVAIATLKGQLMSNSTSGISSNSQRKMVRTDNGIYHVIYESMGNVFYTHSLTSNFDGAWAADQLLIDNAKNPAIEYDGNVVKTVCEYYDPLYTTEVKLYLFTFIQGVDGKYYLNPDEEVFATCPSSYFGSVKPVISYNSGQISLVYRKNSTEGLKISTKRNSSGVWSWLAEATIPETNANSINPSIIGENGKLHIAFESLLTIKYKMGYYRGGSAWEFEPLITLSTGTGYSSNFAPSISLCQYAYPYVMVSWRGHYSTILEKNLSKTEDYSIDVNAAVAKVGYGTSWGGSSSFSNNVNYTNNNSLNSSLGSILTWSESSGSITKFVKRNSNGTYGTITNLSVSPANGIQTFVSNGSNFSEMEAMVFNTSTSAPYLLNRCTNNFSQGALEKVVEGQLSEITFGRSGVVEKNGVEFLFNIGDVLLDGQSIGFIERIDTLPVADLTELNSSARTNIFNLNSASELIFSDYYYVVNKSSASNFTDEFSLTFKCELVNAATNQVVGTFDNVTYNKFNVQEYDNPSYLVDCSGIESGSYYLRLNTAVNEEVNLYVGDIQRDDIVLEKQNLIVRNFKGEGIPTSYDLAQNYPNPFNPSTTIRYQLPQNGIVTLKIYDVLGSEIATLVNEEKVAGKYEVNFNAISLASGVYIYKIQAGDFISSKKMILLK